MSYYTFQLSRRNHSTRTFIIRLEESQASRLSTRVNISHENYSLNLSPLDVIDLGLVDQPQKLFSVKCDIRVVYVVGTEEQVTSRYKNVDVPGFPIVFEIEEKLVVPNADDFVNCLLEQQGKGSDNYARTLKEIEEEIMAAQRKIKLLKEKKDRLVRSRECIKEQVIAKANELVRANTSSPPVSEDEDEIEAEGYDE